MRRNAAKSVGCHFGYSVVDGEVFSEQVERLGRSAAQSSDQHYVESLWTKRSFVLTFFVIWTLYTRASTHRVGPVQSPSSTASRGGIDLGPKSVPKNAYMQRSDALPRDSEILCEGANSVFDIKYSPTSAPELSFHRCAR